MTGTDAVWSAKQRELWQRLDTHDFGSADCTLSFARKLAREHGWSQSHADGAIREYKRFCFLAAVAGHVVSPSDAVDEVWHLHLTYSRDYWQRYCPDVLGTDLHHEPTPGGTEQSRLHYDQYAQTLASYQHWFGPPPEAFWPNALEQTARPARFRRVDLARSWLLPRPRLPRPDWRQIAAALMLLSVAPLLHALPLNPLDFEGPAFLGLFLVLFLACIGITTLLRRQLKDIGGQSRGAELDTWSIAYLAGGAERVVDAGMASLLAGGQAKWDTQKKRLDIAHPQQVHDYPLDEIARAAAAEPSVNRIVRRVDGRLERIRAALLARKLLIDDSRRWMLGLISALPFALLTLLGVTKIIVGMSRDRPVGFLIFLTLISGAVALLVLLKRPVRSRAGDTVLREMNTRHAHARRAPRDTDIGLAVALAGTAVLAGTAYAGFHDFRSPSSGSSGSSDSSSASSDSSDSGSSCSSGCGGCGGGGGD
jgi:uncharacterized protein (TIGR04222 family)